MTESRQLAVIMFTDIVGYTSMMGYDEHRAIGLLKKNRQMQQPIIDQFRGKWIKEIGDGILASFMTVSDSVNAAMAIQEQCNANKDFQLRIGIHLGEVIFDNEDVFGDGVNIASRIQSVAKPGTIYVSESIYQNVINKKDIPVRFVKEEVLKNVKDSVRIYEIMTSSSAQFYNIPAADHHKTTGKSIAVLPFVNMSNDPDQEYFSDGMAEEILNSLSHLQDLRVAGRTSSFQFKGKNIDIREVGEKLHVRTVLEGSVRKQGNRLRITAQLVNVDDGYHMWSEKYDRNMDDLFAVQDEIALAITEQLKIKLMDREREIITKIATQNAEAYECYLKGRFYIERRGNFILTGLDYFKQAIELDPDYAQAYAGYAEANLLSSVYSFQAGKTVMQKVKKAAETAIRLDDSIGQAYGSLALYYISLERNWEESRKNFKKSLALDPNQAIVHSMYGMCQLGLIDGNYAEAEKELLTAIRLEPLSAIDHADLSWTLHSSHKFDQALAVAKIAIDLDANSFLSHRLAGLNYISLGRYEDAIETLTHLTKISNRHQHAVNSLIWAYCAKGDFDNGRLLMEELKQRARTEYIAGTYLGLSAGWLGDQDAAIQYIEEAIGDTDPILIHVKQTPSVPVALRNDPRFQPLLDKIGFPK